MEDGVHASGHSTGRCLQAVMLAQPLSLSETHLRQEPTTRGVQRQSTAPPCRCLPKKLGEGSWRGGRMPLSMGPCPCPAHSPGEGRPRSLSGAGDRGWRMVQGSGEAS